MPRAHMAMFSLRLTAMDKMGNKHPIACDIRRLFNYCDLTAMPCVVIVLCLWLYTAMLLRHVGIPCDAFWCLAMSWWCLCKVSAMPLRCNSDVAGYTVIYWDKVAVPWNALQCLEMPLQCLGICWEIWYKCCSSAMFFIRSLALVRRGAEKRSLEVSSSRSKSRSRSRSTWGTVVTEFKEWWVSWYSRGS